MSQGRCGWWVLFLLLVKKNRLFSWILKLLLALVMVGANYFFVACLIFSWLCLLNFLQEMYKWSNLKESFLELSHPLAHKSDLAIGVFICLIMYTATAHAAFSVTGQSHRRARPI